MNANNSDEAKREVYNLFLQNVAEFSLIDALPIHLKFGSEVTVDTLVDQKAQWHKSCHLKFSNSKLQETRKKWGRDPEEDESQKIQSNKRQV